MIKKLFTIILLGVTLSSCSALFVSKKQKTVNIKSEESDAKIYLDDELIGRGKGTVNKVEKSGFKQVKIVTPIRTQYHVLRPSGRATGWYVTMPIDCIFAIPTFGYSLMSAFSSQAKFYKYASDNVFRSPYTDPKKLKDEKDIKYFATKIKINDIKNDLKYFVVNYKKGDLSEEYQKAEDKAYKLEQKKAKKNSYNSANIDLIDDSKVNYDDSYFSGDMFNLLISTGYIDTTGIILKNNQKIMGLESTIVGGKMYNAFNSASNKTLFRVKFDIDWKIKNVYGQTLDSVRVSEFSDEFAFKRWYLKTDERDNDLRTAFQNAVTNSFLKLYELDEFDNNIKIGKNIMVTKNQQVTITKPSVSNYVTNTKDALKAAVSIKLKDNKGHGSGFAISTDGYILTNYHVVAGDQVNDFKKFTVILPNGTEEEGTVISSDPIHDIVLIKINAPFEKCFEVSKEKEYENFMEVTTVGTPISIQLGSSVASGILSNERDVEGKKILQLNMSVSPGNSGGPLFDSKTGKLHGVITSKLIGKNTEGISFAAPAFYILEQLNIKFQ